MLLQIYFSFWVYICNIKLIINHLKIFDMKKIILFMVCAFTMFTYVKADNDRAIQIGELPINAQNFISKYFNGIKMAMVKEESGLFYKNYDVIFTNGDKLEFDNNGNWSEVKSIKNGVPNEIIPSQILDYVKSNYPSEKILQIEREDNEYEIKLTNRWEIKFDKKFRVIDIDN